MKKTIKEARAELLVDTLDIQNEMLKSIIIEMLSSSNSYEYERLEGLLLGVEPFITTNHVSLETIKQIMLDEKVDFCTSSVRIESINNMRGYINVCYTKNENDSYESYYTVYFNTLMKKDEKFKMLF